LILKAKMSSAGFAFHFQNESLRKCKWSFTNDFKFCSPEQQCWLSQHEPVSTEGDVHETLFGTQVPPPFVQASIDTIKKCKKNSVK